MGAALMAIFRGLLARGVASAAIRGGTRVAASRGTQKAAAGGASKAAAGAVKAGGRAAPAAAQAAQPAARAAQPATGKFSFGRTFGDISDAIAEFIQPPEPQAASGRGAQKPAMEITEFLPDRRKPRSQGGRSTPAKGQKVLFKPAPKEESPGQPATTSVKQPEPAQKTPAPRTETNRGQQPNRSFDRLLDGIRTAIGSGTVEKAQERTREVKAAQKPAVDFSKLVTQMGAPDALADAKQKADRDEIQQAQELARAEQAETAERQKLIPTIQKLGAVAGKVIGPFAKLAAAGATFLVGLRLWTDRLEASRSVLRRYNGQIALSLVKLDIQKIQHGRKLATETSTSTVRLNKDIAEFREAMRPLESVVRTAANTIASAILNIGTTAAHAVQLGADLYTTVVPAGIVLKGIYNLMERDSNRSDGELPKTTQKHLIDEMLKMRQLNARPDLDPLPPLGK